MTVVVHSRSEEVGWNRIRTRELPFKPRLARKMQECEPASSVLLPRDICILRTCEIATMRHANVIASKTSAQNNSMWELFVIHESLQKSRYRYRMKRPWQRKRTHALLCATREYDVNDTAASFCPHFTLMLAHCAHMVLFSNLMFSSSGGAQASLERERE